MATKKKMLQAAAGQAGGAGLDITEVFSTYLYDGNGATQTITNDIDLAGEGGLVWGKSRTDNGVHSLYDTERGVQKPLFSNATNAQGDDSAGGSTSGLYQFNSDGFNLGSDWAGNINVSGQDMASWTFRKAPKFFTCLTYTGTGPGSATNEQQVSHNLEAKPGIVIIKSTVSGDWWVFTDVIDGSNDYGYLNQTSAFGNSGNNVATDSVFNVGGALNTSGETYVAYLFANNNGDGEFGPDGDQDIIKCGSYTGNGSTDGPEIDLGFEPQWVLVKRTDDGANWLLMDAMRGIPTGDEANLLLPNASGSEADYANLWGINLLPTGFKPNVTQSQINASGGTYIYMAIRRGPLAQPESGTEVFEVATRTSGLPSFKAPFAVDMGLVRKGTNTAGGVYNASRLTGTKFLYTNGTDAEANDNGFVWDFMDGFANDGGENNTVISWMWKRAPGFFDVVAYTGNGTAGRTVSHNLGVAPEMMWVKCRSHSGENWAVYHSALGASKFLELNNTSATINGTTRFAGVAPTSSVFSVGQDNSVNGSGKTYIAYLFASLDGVSKVGSYTGNGSSQTIDCGFTSGARFVLIKKTSGTGDWIVHDTVRGIVGSSGADPWLELHTTNAEQSGFNVVEPDSSGFAVTTFNDWNENNHNYIFYAIA